MTAAVTKPLTALHKYQTVGTAYDIGHAHTHALTFSMHNYQECLCVMVLMV